MITPQDKELLENKGISEEQIAEQLACFEKGFPYLKLSAAASVEKGILAPDTDEQKKYLDAWEAYTQTDKVVVKFVPASGASSSSRRSAGDGRSRAWSAAGSARKACSEPSSGASPQRCSSSSSASS